MVIGGATNSRQRGREREAVSVDRSGVSDRPASEPVREPVREHAVCAVHLLHLRSLMSTENSPSCSLAVRPKLCQSEGAMGRRDGAGGRERNTSRMLLCEGQSRLLPGCLQHTPRRTHPSPVRPAQVCAGTHMKATCRRARSATGESPAIGERERERDRPSAYLASEEK